MLRGFLKNIGRLKSKTPLVYSVLLIVLVPVTLIVNTWWNLRAFERDMNFSVREQALAVEDFVRASLAFESDEDFGVLVENVLKGFDEVVSMSILAQTNDGMFEIKAASSKQVGDLDKENFLNSMAWTQDQSYFTKSFDSVSNKNLWVLVTPMKNGEGDRIGLMNLKIDSSMVDEVVSRTSRDSLIILGISVLFVILLLANHLKFFERAMLVDKLKEIDQMKDDFISVASHELRTPLTAIKSAISMMQEDFSEQLPKDVSELFDIVNQSVSRLGSLVNDLLNVSRIEQDRLDFVMKDVDIQDAIGEVINQLKFRAEEKGLTLGFEKSDEKLLVLANRDRLIEVLVNLIGNSVKYTLRGFVRVKILAEQKVVRILIQDSGIGIANEDKDKLFQKFSRISSSETKEIPGSGLGLWITKAMVEKMKGKIYVDSVVEQGTTFTVVLKRN